MFGCYFPVIRERFSQYGLILLVYNGCVYGGKAGVCACFTNILHDKQLLLPLLARKDTGAIELALPWASVKSCDNNLEEKTFTPPLIKVENSTSP